MILFVKKKKYFDTSQWTHEKFFFLQKYNVVMEKNKNKNLATALKPKKERRTDLRAQIL